MKILLVLPRGFEDLEAAAFADVLGWTSGAAGVEVGVDTCGIDSPVTSARGLALLPRLRPADVDPDQYRALALPGGYHGLGYTQAYEPEMLDLYRAIAAREGIVASICVGALPLARAGLLAGRRATTYPHDNGRHARVLTEAGAIYTGAVVEQDGQFITGNGPGAAIEVSFLLASRLLGEAAVARARELMCIGREDRLSGQE